RLNSSAFWKSGCISFFYTKQAKKTKDLFRHAHNRNSQQRVNHLEHRRRFRSLFVFFVCFCNYSSPSRSLEVMNLNGGTDHMTTQFIRFLEERVHLFLLHQANEENEEFVPRSL